MKISTTISVQFPRLCVNLAIQSPRPRAQFVYFRPLEIPPRYSYSRVSPKYAARDEFLPLQGLQFQITTSHHFFRPNSPLTGRGSRKHGPPFCTQTYLSLGLPNPSTSTRRGAGFETGISSPFARTCMKSGEWRALAKSDFDSRLSFSMLGSYATLTPLVETRVRQQNILTQVTCWVKPPILSDTVI